MGTFKCPFCLSKGSVVLDSRLLATGDCQRRRRYCQKCERRFTTHELVTSIALQVFKKDGRTQKFDPDKLSSSIAKAFACSIFDDRVANLSLELKSEIYNRYRDMVGSHFIGALVLEALKEKDEAAYVRYISVFKNFESPAQLLSFLEVIQ